jgi:kynureninase
LDAHDQQRGAGLAPQYEAQAMTLPASRADCEAWDARDPLARIRCEFRVEPGVVYLDGNSLGALTHDSVARARAMIEDEWGRDLIRSWNVHGWFDLPQRLGAKIAPFIGAAADEVLVADSTSVNLFKLASAAMMTRGTRHRIVTESGNFPTDIYVLQGLAALSGGAIEVVAVPRSEVAARIDESTFLVVLTHVHYKTAELFDLQAITRRAHAQGARILWDLSHSVGALAVDLGAARADFAVGCTYKYLNGGPGSPAFLYVRRDLQEAFRPGLAAWMGHAAPFEFTDDYEPAPGIARYRSGTPSLIAFAALEGALGVWDGVDLCDVRRKSEALTELFIAGVEALTGSGLILASPREAVRRGSHVALTHPRGYELIQALIARGVIGDFRAPDVVRFGFAPLYLRYVDVWEAVTILGEVLAALDRTELARRSVVT